MCPGDARPTFGQTVTSLGRVAGQCLSWGAAGHLRCPKGPPLPPPPQHPALAWAGEGGAPKHLWVHEQAESQAGEGAELRLQHRLRQHVPCQRSPVMGLGLCQASWGQQVAGGQPHASPTLAQATGRRQTRGATLRALPHGAEARHDSSHRCFRCPALLTPGMRAGQAGRGQSLLRRGQGAGRGGQQQGPPLFGFATHWNGAEGHWERREPHGCLHPCSRLYRTPPVPAVPPRPPSQPHTPACSPPPALRRGLVWIGPILRSWVEFSGAGGDASTCPPQMPAPSSPPPPPAPAPWLRCPALSVELPALNNSGPPPAAPTPRQHPAGSLPAT
ncbi:uncharacterized protein ACIBXB_019967 [Morphnus guianensis]